MTSKELNLSRGRHRRQMATGQAPPQIAESVPGIRVAASEQNDTANRLALVKTHNIEGVTRLYQHDCPLKCCPQRWSEFPSFQDEEDDLDRRTAKVPILHRHVYNNKKWVTQSFTIQCPVIKDIIRHALHKYQDLDMDLEAWTFTPPYRALVHRWDKLKEIQMALTDAPKIASAKSLMEFLTPVLTESVESLSHTKRTGKINFNNVWQIFPPGVLALTKLYGVETICRVIKYEHKRIDNGPIWIITLEFVDWNGQKCGYSTTSKMIEKFDGFKHVKDLPVYAMSFDDASEEKQIQMLKRGRRFERFRGYHFLTCNENGRKIVFDEYGGSKLKAVSGRIVIDAFAYFRVNNDVRPELRSLTESTEEKKGPDRTADRPKHSNSSDEETHSDTSGEDDEFTNSMRLVNHFSRTAAVPGASPRRTPPPPPPTAPFISTRLSTNDHELTTTNSDEATFRMEDLTTLTEEQCIIATPWLKGMDLKTKEWGLFFVDELQDIVWNEKAFDNLVLPEEDKALTWDFVEAKSLSNNKYDDFIADKGRGTIILMFGPPGVGKTYTAEAVAEKSRVPLYAVSAGVLGTTPHEVEKALDQSLDLCRLWNAILLLDEADVFLGTRTNDGLLRNELVSLFLTKLEYYQGILFLTTNRISSIDHAFQSRIDLFLPYYDLNSEARRRVWENFINHLGAQNFEISQSDLFKLSEIPLNGREIKNLIKSSQLLSVKTGEKINIGRLLMLAEKRVKALQLLSEHQDTPHH